MIGPEKVGCRSVMSSSSSSKKALVCCRVAIRVRTGMLTDATGETCEALVTGEEAGVSLGGVCTGVTCREQRREEEKKKKEIKGSAILKKKQRKRNLAFNLKLFDQLQSLWYNTIPQI